MAGTQKAQIVGSKILYNGVEGIILRIQQEYLWHPKGKRRVSAKCKFRSTFSELILVIVSDQRI